ncbi:MAG: hypothetical protein HC845_12610 [Akkermansiaceae bacterium]|nr:hypothetical protein [Akkermansiaceae bacterium]
MVASERESTGKMVLASGLPWSWIAGGDGFSVRGLITRYGPLDFQIAAKGKKQIHFHICETIQLPEKGLFISPPLPPGHRIVSALAPNDSSLMITPDGDSVMVKRLPISVTLLLDDELPIPLT